MSLMLYRWVQGVCLFLPLSKINDQLLGLADVELYPMNRSVLSLIVTYNMDNHGDVGRIHTIEFS